MRAGRAWLARARGWLVKASQPVRQPTHPLATTRSGLKAVASMARARSPNGLPGPRTRWELPAEHPPARAQR
jgi:hypothetical protein